MDKAVLSPSKPSNTPPEKTLKLLHERLDQAEQEAKKLSEQLSGYGFNPDAGTPSKAGRRSIIETITPLDKYEAGKYEMLKGNYEELVARVCRTESVVQSLKLALVSLEAEKNLMNRDSVAGALNANEAYEKELMKMKKDLVKTRKALDESETFRAQTEVDFQKVRDVLNIKTGSNKNVVKLVQELKEIRDKLTKQVNELKTKLDGEKTLRQNSEDSHKDLLARVTEMEKLVEEENREMKLLSGDCARLKHELNETRSQYDREYQTRMQLENLVERLTQDAEEMESKLLSISNDRKALDTSLAKLKRENKELKQQLEFVRKSSETLKEVNLDLEKRYKEASESLRVTERDNKILVAQHRDSVDKERRAFAEKLKEQDQLLDEAKESIFQELSKEKQTILDKEKEILKLKDENTSQQKLLHKKDVELSNLKDILEKLNADREKMVEENDKVLIEIKRDLDQFVSEKISLVAELDDRKVEHSTMREQNERLNEECETLRSRLSELEQQQTNYDRINNALQNMVEDKRRLAYDKGVLQTENEKLKINSKEYKQKLRDTENELRKLQDLAFDKEKESHFLTKQKEEAVKETERVIRETDLYERKYSKQIDSLQDALVKSKEDNKKLAGTLDAVITSHTQLQSSCERLQTELGKRDSQLTYLENERSEKATKIMDLNREIESLKAKVTQQRQGESKELNTLRRTLDLLQQDREKLLDTVEPLMKTNKDLQESLEGLANELKQKNNDIKKLRASSVSVKREIEIETVALETKVDDARKEFDREMKEVRTNHKKEITKLRKDFQEMLKLKNSLKEENATLKREQEEAEIRHKKLREKFKQTKGELEQCFKLQAGQQTELEAAKEKINAMDRELVILEKLKSEYTQNNMEQARSLQEFISQLTELQEEFRTLAEAQQESSLLCRQKDERIKREKMRRKEIEVQCHELKNRQKQLKVKQDVAARQLEEANYESHQVAVNLQEAHDWFKDKFSNLQSELNKSRKIQSVLQKDNVDQYKALHEERRRAEEATERAKEIIKSSRMMISRLVGQVYDNSQESGAINGVVDQNGQRSSSNFT